jgi:cytochrome c-type biogenesis protein CcmE
MLIIIPILIICFVVIVILFKAQPNLSMFQLPEKVVGKGYSDKRDEMAGLFVRSLGKKMRR